MLKNSIIFILLFTMLAINCEINDEKLHIRNIYIKYKIIIIFQYTIAEYVALVV